MKEPSIKFSIIIPCYNMEKYIERCLDSAINQTYPNLEIIVVNDGSKDRSLELIKQYAEKDSRIVLIDKKNGGIGPAYADAFAVMNGDYAGFLDADDYLDLNAYETFYRYINQYNEPDAIHYGQRTFDEAGNFRASHSYQPIFIQGNDQIIPYQFKNLGINLMKIVKTSLLKNIKLFKQNVAVDFLTTCQLSSMLESLLVIEDVFYNVWLRETSVSHQISDEKITRTVLNTYNQLEEIECVQKKKQLIQLLELRKVRLILSSAKELNQCGRKKEAKELAKKFNYPQIYREFLKSKTPVSIKTRIKFGCYRWFPRLYLMSSSLFEFAYHILREKRDNEI